MTKKSLKDKILLNRLAYFFKHFKPEQKKFMSKSMDDFLAESQKTAPTSKSLYKILEGLFFARANFDANKALDLALMASNSPLR